MGAPSGDWVETGNQNWRSRFLLRAGLSGGVTFREKTVFLGASRGFRSGLRLGRGAGTKPRPLARLAEFGGHRAALARRPDSRLGDYAGRRRRRAARR